MKLLDAIAQVESGSRSYAVRSEVTLIADPPTWAVTKNNQIMSANACNRATATIIACSSWGQYQLLGCNIYMLGYSGPIMSYPFDLQTQHALSFAAHCGLDATLDMSDISDIELEVFSRGWNGPADPVAYAAALRKAAL